MPVAQTTTLSDRHDRPMPDAAADSDSLDPGRIAAQRLVLPPAWRALDRLVVRGTEIAVCAIGGLFTILIVVEVLSRYVLKFSIMFVNAGSRFLLVWFFTVGAGLALRHGAHAGFDLLVTKTAANHRRRVVVAAQLLALLFFLEMLWAGVHSLGAAWTQVEPGLEISLVWGFLAIPVGFALLVYHLAVLMAATLRRGAESAGGP